MLIAIIIGGLVRIREEILRKLYKISIEPYKLMDPKLIFLAIEALLLEKCKNMLKLLMTILNLSNSIQVL